MNEVRTLADLETALAQAGQSPRDGGRLVLIVRRPGVDEREAVKQAELTLEEGLAGDNWVSRDGAGCANFERQLTLRNSRVTAVLAQDPARWALAGDQLFVDLDLSEDNLPPGTLLAIGQAVLEVTALPHNGCAKFTARFGSDGTRFVNSPQGRREHRRGVNARVVQPGAIQVGDLIRKV